MKEYPKDYRTHIDNLVTFCRNELWHGVYRYAIEWHITPLDGKPSVVADMEICDIYTRFTLRMGPPSYQRWKEKDYKRIGETILHEICHLIFYPHKRFGWENCDTVRNKTLTEIDERQTQLLSVVLMPLLPKEWYMPKNAAAYMADLHKGK